MIKVKADFLFFKGKCNRIVAVLVKWFEKPFIVVQSSACSFLCLSGPFSSFIFSLQRCVSEWGGPP